MHPTLLYQLTNHIHERHCEILQRSLNPDANTSAGQLIEGVMSALANPFAYRPDTPIDQPAGRPYRASARSMDLLVSFHSQCRGVKFYDLRSAEAEWGTKLKRVKEPTNLHDPLCVTAWVTGIPGERGADGARPLRRTGRTRRRETLHDTLALPNS